MAVSKFVVSLKLSIISLPESLQCCYTCVDFCHAIAVGGDFTMLQKSWGISIFCHCCLECRFVATIGSNASTFNSMIFFMISYENVAEKDRETSWTKCGKKSSRQMWNIVKSEAVKLYNYICDFMRSAFVMFYPVLWLG